MHYSSNSVVKTGKRDRCFARDTGRIHTESSSFYETLLLKMEWNFRSDFEIFDRSRSKQRRESLFPFRKVESLIVVTYMINFLKFSENRIDRRFFTPVLFPTGLLYTVILSIANFQDRFPEPLMSANLDDYTRLWRLKVLHVRSSSSTPRNFSLPSVSGGTSFAATLPRNVVASNWRKFVKTVRTARDGRSCAAH